MLIKNKINHSLVAITLFSVILCSLLWWLTPINFYPDSEQYVRTAFALTNRPGEFYYFRTWGYPIALVLLGVTKFHTFYPVLIVQALLGIAIPIVIFKTLHPFNHATATLAAFITAISFAPFIWQKLIMTDQISMFLYYFLAYSASRFIFSQSNKNLFLIWLIGFMLFLMRPSAMLIYLCTMSCLLIFFPNLWRKICLAMCLFVITIFSFQFLQKTIVSKYNDTYQMKSSFTTGSMVGRMFFYNIYAVGPFYTHVLTVEPINGKCSANIYNSIIQWGNNHPTLRHHYFGNKTSSDIASQLFSYPNLFNHSIMWLIMDQHAGSIVADRIFACAAFESLFNHPKASLLFPVGFIQFFMSGDVVYNDGKKVISNAESIVSALESAYLSADPNFPNELQQELSQDVKTHKDATDISRLIYKGIFYWQTSVKMITTILSIIFLPACFVAGRRIACMTSLILFYLIYQATIAVIFASPHYRYSAPQIPLIIMLACIGISMFYRDRGFFIKLKAQSIYD